MHCFNSSNLRRSSVGGRSSLLPKLLPLTQVALLVFSTYAFADGNGAGASSAYGGNGGYSGAGGGGGTDGLAGAKGGLAPVASAGTASGNGGKGADGGRSAPTTDPLALGGAGGLVGTNGKGGNGANGQDAFCASVCSNGYGAGGGGGGGDGFHGSNLSSISTAITGGNGGKGGDSGADGGSGGGGGAGAVLSGSGTTTTQGSITGGNGGNGGSGGATVPGAGAGYGGHGGSGLTSNGVSVINNHTITGGNGGLGADSLATSYNSAGGSGGAGVKASNMTLTNNGTITGGNGGSSTANARQNGVIDQGGAGVTGSNLNIINSGSIKGGLAADGTTRANAITFTSGTNSLQLEQGSTITGNVVGTGKDKLILGGDQDSSFDLSKVGSSTAYQYSGFNQFEKNGDSTWTLNNIAGAAQNWSLLDGTLRLNQANAFNGGSATLAGGNLDIASGNFGGGLILAADNTGTVNITSGNTTIGGAVSGAGDLIKTGAGTLTLSKTGSYTGDTLVQEGTLALTGANSIGKSSNVSINQNATINTGANAQQLNNLTGAGLLQGSGNVTLNNDIDTTFDGTIQGALSLIKSGVQNLTLKQAAEHLGGTLINAGTLTLEAVNALAQSSGVTIADNATLDLGSELQQLNNLSGAGDLFGSATLTLNNTADSLFSGDLTLTGDAGLIKTGTGALSLNGVVDYSGDTNIQAGTLTLGSADALAKSSNINIDQNATLNTGSYQQQLNNLSGAGNLQGDGSISVNNLVDTTFSGVFSGQGDLIKTGSGSLTLSGVNTYSGDTQIEQGLLNLQVANALAQSRNVTIDAGASINGGGLAQQLGNLSGSGDLLNSGALTLNNSADSLYHGAINLTDGAGLTKTGTGELQLTSNSHNLSGDINVNEGTLTLANTSTLSVNGNYTTAANATTSLGAGVLDISGDLIQQSGSKLEINLSETGGIKAKSAQLNQSTLSVAGFSDLTSRDALLKASDMDQNTYTLIETTDGITGFESTDVEHPDFMLIEQSLGNNDRDLILGTRLAWTAGSSQESTGSFTLEEGTGFNVDLALNDQTGDFSGTGWDGKSLTKNGEGVLQLSMVNGYTGGTTINGGILQISQDGNLGASSGEVTLNGGTLQVDQGFNTSRNFNLLDNGGALDVVQGELSLQGALSGNGDLEKNGAGTLNLQGDTSDYSGDVNINQGTLNLASSLSGSLSGSNQSMLNISADNIGGDLTLNSGARLMMQSAAQSMMAFSESSTPTLNHLNVNGNVSFADGGIYAPSIDSQGAADLLSVDGKASLDGGQLDVTALPGTYSGQPVRYRVLSAGEGIDGTFDNYSISNPLLTMTPEYESNDLYLSVSRNDTPIDSIGATPNQRQVAAAIDSLDASNRLNAAIVALPSAEEINDALNQLAGEIYASLKSSMAEETHFIRDAANARLQATANGQGAQAINKQQEVNFADNGLWMHGWGSWGKLNGSEQTGATMDRNIGGLLIGGDRELADWRVGGLIGYTHTEAKVKTRASESNGNNLHLGAYAGRSLDLLNIRYGVMYAYYHNSVERSIDFPGYSDQLKANVNAHALHGFAEFAMPQQWNDLSWEPYANLAYVYLNTGSFHESGQEAALSANSQSSENAFTTLGSRVGYRLQTNVPVELSAQLGWKHAYGKIVPESKQRFDGSTDFTVLGAPLMKDALITGVSAQFDLAPDMKLGASYQGTFGDKGRENALMGTFTWSF
ncbi:autotransporter domain-containing protein [Serratia microhaemolytica]|uniref:autotransporter domain-containing protein n=1 Tax=Serratia microhaemolytica TaxID=2675110 RepID=UPI0012D761A8|nr:autotransporter domain-containing protein [Serratia microhaemolytica]